MFLFQNNTQILKVIIWTEETLKDKFQPVGALGLRGAQASGIEEDNSYLTRVRFMFTTRQPKHPKKNVHLKISK